MYQNFYYFTPIWSSTCFGRHTAHHQEPKTALAASGLSYVEGCWTCSWWTLSGTMCLTTSTSYTSNNLPRMINQRLPMQFRLLMMGGVSPETCWASYRCGIIKILIHYFILLDFLYELYYDSRIHKHQVNFISRMVAWMSFLCWKLKEFKECGCCSYSTVEG